MTPHTTRSSAPCLSKWVAIMLLVGGSVDAGCQPSRPQSSPSLADSLYTFKSPSSDGTGKFFLGREISRVMGAAGADWLERPGRQQQENSTMAIKKMGLTDSTVVADIGAGTGYYSFAIAARVPRGLVYAVDVQQEMIEHLNAKKAAANAKNVVVIKGDTVSAKLPVGSVDLAVMVDVYHELAFPYEMIQSVDRALKPDGRILLIEYRGEDPSVPIKPLHKTTVKQLLKEFDVHGFNLVYRGDFLPIQHFLVFKRR